MILSRSWLSWSSALLGLRARAALAAVTPAKQSTYTVLFNQTEGLELGSPATVAFTVDLAKAATAASNLSMILCQSSKDLASAVNPTNIWKVLDILTDICASSLASTPPDKTCDAGQTLVLASNSISHQVSVELSNELTFNGTGTDSLSNFFFCFAHSDGSLPSNDVCDYYSNMFDIKAMDGTNSIVPIVPVPAAKKLRSTTLLHARAPPDILSTTAMTITSTKTTLLNTVTKATVNPTGIAIEPTTINTATATATLATTDSTAEAPSGMAVGSKVGVAIGVIIIIGLLAAATFFLIKRRKNALSRMSGNTTKLPRSKVSDSSPPSESPAVEKNNDNSGDSPTPVKVWPSLPPPPLPPTKTSTPSHPPTIIHNETPSAYTADQTVTMVNSYPDSLNYPAENYSEPQANNDNLMPRRKPLTTPSRGISIVSNASATPSTMGVPPAPPIMSANTTALLREEGMSPEEVARLEEEERVLDAAIAEAERTRALGLR